VRLSLLPKAMEFILAQEEGKARLLKAVTDLSKLFALSVPHEDALHIRDEVAFFQAVRAALVKTTTSERTDEELDHAVRQLVSKAIVPSGVVDIFSAAGLARPDLSILSDEFLAEVRDLPQKNLAVETLRKVLNDELRAYQKRSIVQSKLFSEKLERTIRSYQNRALTAAQIIEQLIDLAKEMKAAERRGEDLGLSEEELAFYDALEVNDSAVQVLGDDTLREIARELVDTVRRNTSVEWNLKESARAKLRVIVKRILRKYGYPPDKQERATITVLQQAELFSEQWLLAVA
jgi:type I restriction enzyme R subunit